MRICFFNSGNIDELLTEDRHIIADVFCMPFTVLGEVFYDRELDGGSDKFGKLVKLSKKLNGVIVGGCYTDMRGIKRKSVAVADRGRLIGIADANYIIKDKNFKSGYGLKVFQTSAGKLGIAVAEDILFPEVVRSLSLFGSDVILSIYEGLDYNIEQVVIRSHSFIYGINICMCAYAYSQGSDCGGMLAFATSTNPFVYELTSGREYRIIESRQRGFLRRTRD